MTNKKKKTSVEQMIEDMEKYGVPEEAISMLKGWVDANSSQAGRLSYYFDHHQYNDKCITFTQLSNKVELNCICDKNQLSILMLFIQNIHQSGEVRISTRNIQALTGCSSSTVNKVMKYFRDNGFLALKTKGRGTTPPVYMLNPEIACAGKKNTWNSEEAFWKLAGDEAKKNWTHLTLSNYVDTEVGSLGLTGSEDYHKFNIVKAKEGYDKTMLNEDDDEIPI